MYEQGLPHPRTFEFNRNSTAIHRIEYQLRSDYDINKVVVKPYTSMEQGANVKVVNLSTFPWGVKLVTSTVLLGPHPII